MILELCDWRFLVDIEATGCHTTKNAEDHCLCGYCKNYYETIAVTYPEIGEFLDRFGVNLHGPSELMPFAPTLMLACYRVCGKILTWGKAALSVSGISVLPETADENSFFLWVGEMEIPWLQEENVEDVVSPANLPEFLERMQEVWLLRHGEEIVFS